MWRAGDRARLRYKGQPLWHERLVIGEAHVGNSEEDAYLFYNRRTGALCRPRTLRATHVVAGAALPADRKRASPAGPARGPAFGHRCSDQCLLRGPSSERWLSRSLG